MIRKPNDAEAAQIRRLWEDSFPEGGPDFVDWFFSTVYDSAHTLGYFEGDGMLANLQMVPYRLRLRGATLPMDTLTGVATDAAHRKQGLARVLMTHSLEDMARRGRGFTFLYPFNHEFYKRLGWETCSASLEYLLSAAELPEPIPAGWSVARTNDADAAVLDGLYRRFMAGRNCFVEREEANWSLRLGENNASGGFQLIVSQHGVPQAYALCEDVGEEIQIGELVSTSVAATGALLAALKPLGKAVDWTGPADDRAMLLGLPWKDRAKLQPHVMLRLTDVALAFGQASPACDGQLVIEVTGDTMRPANNGRYRVTARESAASVERADAQPDFTCGVGAWARILSGYCTAAETVGAGQAEGSPDAVALLCGMYPPQNNFLFELY